MLRGMIIPLWMKLEGTPGQGIEEVCSNMIAARDKLGVAIELKFNGILLLCGPSSTKESIHQQYIDATK